MYLDKIGNIHVNLEAIFYILPSWEAVFLPRKQMTNVLVLSLILVLVFCIVL